MCYHDKHHMLVSYDCFGVGIIKVTQQQNSKALMILYIWNKTYQK